MEGEEAMRQPTIYAGREDAANRWRWRWRGLIVIHAVFSFSGFLILRS